MYQTLFNDPQRLLELIKSKAPSYYPSYISQKISSRTTMLEDLRTKWAHASLEDRKKIEAAAENIKQELIMYKSYDTRNPVRV